MSSSRDVYVPLAQLQKLASQTSLANVVLVRADSGTSVAAVQKEIEQRFPHAQVASSKDVTAQISGSLVDASNLSHRLGITLAILAAFAFLMAALLTLLSVGKRVRELGTLKALGWTQRMVVRQVVGESFAIIDLLESLAAQRGATVIVATHDAGLAARAPRRLAMRDGAILRSAAPEPAATV